ncbi:MULTISPECIES: hypothetical protein [unclassified Brevibacterium]|uniref:hypothetical protein n=1 Tax=unclassified Brevibacterium TaxID=2614124 RepID=UPI00143CFCDF|nr:hypothetical protein [Brevibacterium sp. S22]
MRPGLVDCDIDLETARRFDRVDNDQSSLFDLLDSVKVSDLDSVDLHAPCRTGKMLETETIGLLDDVLHINVCHQNKLAQFHVPGQHCDSQHTI